MELSINIFGEVLPMPHERGAPVGSAYSDFYYEVQERIAYALGWEVLSQHLNLIDGGSTSAIEVWIHREPYSLEQAREPGWIAPENSNNEWLYCVTSNSADSGTGAAPIWRNSNTGRLEFWQ